MFPDSLMYAQAGFPQRTLDMLFGQGQYTTITAQINYDPAVHAQIGAAEVRAWKALPNKAAGDQLSKVVQGSSELYSEFVSLLMQLAGKIFGDVDTAMPVIKQLAFENANKYCKEALRAHKDKSLYDIIRLCRDIDGNHITGQVLAAAIRQGFGRDPGARPKVCFGCGQPGHFRKDCPKGKQQAGQAAPGICPKCKKGIHWSNECRSKYDAQGNPIQLGNGQRGLLRGPQKAQVYIAMNAMPGSGLIQYIPIHNPFLASPGEPQAVQDWSSVPPP
ncbi:hypothetical protein STEG23_017444 [Scotinomys teguina]